MRWWPVALGIGLLSFTTGTAEPARKPDDVRVNRSLPAFTPVSQLPQLSENPSDEEIARLRLFPQRIVPVEPSSSRSVLGGMKDFFATKQPAPAKQDNTDVLGTLRALQLANDPEDTSQLQAFLTANPQSRWAPALRYELARRQFRQGWFASAIAAWDALWNELRGRRDARAGEVANEVICQLLDAYIGLGNASRLEALIGDQETRPGHPVVQAKILRARQSVWLLRHKGAQNVMCGPVALYGLLKHAHQSFVPIRLNDITEDYIATGISLAQIKKYADHYKLKLVVARKSPGSPIPTPAVMHLATGHYSAILGQAGGQYFLQDQPMQFQGWVSLEALEAQSSGYFLVPAGALPAGWKMVSETESGTVFGRDGMHGQEPFNRSCTHCSQSAGGSGGDCCGMPVYTFHPQIASLRIEDSPLGYWPPVGPPVVPVVAYNDLDDSKPVGPPTFSNVGRIWSISWVAYVDYVLPPGSPDSQLTVHIAGGGTELYSFNDITKVYGPNDRSFATVVASGAYTYTRTLPDGSQEIYNAPDNPAAPNQVFLTQTIDPSGNVVSFSYDSNMRLVAVTDSIGQVTTLQYNWPGDIWKVTRITDPFGRFATFAYNSSSNELSSVTDVIGLTSTFTYDTNEFVTTMTTPYGTTTFANTRAVQPLTSYDYALTATDPEGNQEMVQYIEPIDVPPLAPPLPSLITIGGASIPFTAEAARLQFRNSFYWNKKAMKEGPGDTSVARNYRWLTDENYLITPILESIKEPLEGRVWFNYPGPGQMGGSDYATYPYYAGQGGLPNKTLRLLSDGSPQLTQTDYNALGNLTRAVDPVGRTTTFTYAPNLVDLMEVSQKTGPGAADRLAAYTYNNQHLRLTAVNPAGQQYLFKYNTRGQLLTYLDPTGGTTTLSYDTNGYLLSVDGPLPGTNDTTSLSYDGFGRIRTVTTSDSYTLTFDYDSLDRLTAVTYPDGTSEQVTYNRLDVSAERDRLGRQTAFTYNSLRQLVQVQDALNRISRFGWCSCGALTSITDPLGRMTSWQYDVQSRPIGKQYADGSSVTYSYDSASGQLSSVTDELGQLRVYNYFADDELARISYPNAQVPTSTVTFAYDLNYDRLTSMQDGIGTTKWAYASVGSLGALQLSSVTGPWNNTTVAYSYDALGRLTNRSINGVVESYAYDAIGRVTKAANVLGSFTYDYDGATSRLLDATAPNGLVSRYVYFDNLGDHRLQSITHLRGDGSLVSLFTYAYDSFGNITDWLQEQGPETNAWKLSYDAANQLLQVQANPGGPNPATFSFGYDAAGNLLFANSNNVSRAFSYNALNQLVSSSDADTGNLQYDWDAEGRLTAVAGGTNRSEFSYDGLGRLAHIIDKVNGVVSTDHCLLWTGTSLREERDGTGATVLTRFLPQGEAATGGGGTNYFYTRDHLGSLREVLDTTGALVTRFAYQPYGKQSVLFGPGNAAFGFAGYFIHRPTGLNFTLYRALSTDLGRWLSRDPIGENFAPANLYEYVFNDPTDWIDPLGLQPKAPRVKDYQPKPSEPPPPNPPVTDPQEQAKEVGKGAAKSTFFSACKKFFNVKSPPEAGSEYKRMTTTAKDTATSSGTDYSKGWNKPMGDINKNLNPSGTDENNGANTPPPPKKLQPYQPPAK